MEESEEYHLETESKNDNKHDKIFKEILQNKKEIATLINCFTEYEVREKDLEIYNTEFITKSFKYAQADIVYRDSRNEIYYLIEHQTKVDYSMAYRVLNNCVEIIRSVVEEQEKNRIVFQYPIVIPIVLYTGNRKWTAKTTFAECQNTEDEDKLKMINVKYKLLDINKYEIYELIGKQTMITNMMLLEQCMNNEEVLKCLKMIVKNIKNKDQEKELTRIVKYLYGNIEEINKILEESEVKEKMSTVRERLTREFKKERKIGIAEGILKMAKQMKTKGIEISVIQEITGLTREKIEKL